MNSIDKTIIDNYTNYLITEYRNGSINAVADINLDDDYDRIKRLFDSIIDDEKKFGDKNNPVTFRLIKITPEIIIWKLSKIRKRQWIRKEYKWNGIVEPIPKSGAIIGINGYYGQSKIGWRYNGGVKGVI